MKALINYLVSFFVAKQQPTNHLAVLEHYEKMIAANKKQQILWDRLDRYADLEWHSAIKNAEVVKLEKTEKEEVRIQKSIREIMETRKAQYERGLKLSDLFNGLNVSANVHYVTNQQGTTFIRAFYYLHGTLTPLNVIIAVAQKLAEKDQK